MNNIQLAIFLNNYQARLRIALEETKVDLPKKLEKSKWVLGFEIKSFPVLQQMETVLDSLGDDIELLKRFPEGKNDQ